MEEVFVADRADFAVAEEACQTDRSEAFLDHLGIVVRLGADAGVAGGEPDNSAYTRISKKRAFFNGLLAVPAERILLKLQCYNVVWRFLRRF